ncbi:hypothetical protein ICG_00373 [Bacillus cereus BAG1X1-3]|nr:hypothetical protein ICG_00373 [Bacillus cereus BAG1X1-3]EOO70862.1 hypothetical protein IC7_04502 [Bacillus cereus BAG1O-1]SEA89886.1 hypothetical protein SAMN04488146_104324 [Bacillus nitratireducens]
MFLKETVMTKRGPLTQNCMCYFQIYVKMKGQSELYYMVYDDFILETKNSKIKSSIKMNKLCMCVYHQWSIISSTDGIFILTSLLLYGEMGMITNR